MPVRLFDYGPGVDQIANAIPSAIQGFYDAEDRKLRKQELQAKLSAQRDNQQRNQDFQKFNAEAKLADLQSKNYDTSVLEGKYPAIFGQQGNQGQQTPLMGQGMPTSGAPSMVADNNNPPTMLPDAKGLIGQQESKGLVKLTPFGEQQKNLEQSKLGAQLNNERLALPTKLREEYNNQPTTKRTAEVSEAYRKMIKASESPSAAGDMSLIFGYMKMQDPNSSVREGEQASAQNAAGVPDQIRNTYNKIITGERLNPTQRSDFLNQAGNMHSAQMDAQSQLDNQYIGLAKGYGTKPELVLDKNRFKVEAPKSSNSSSGKPWERFK